MLIKNRVSQRSPGGATTIRKIERGELHHIGEYCGLAMYIGATKSERRERAHQLEWERTKWNASPPPYPFSEADTFLSHERTKGDVMDDFVLNMQCAPTQRKDFCYGMTYFERWPVRLHIPKDRLCDWRDEVARVRGYLAAHVVRRTPKRGE